MNNFIFPVKNNSEVIDVDRDYINCSEMPLGLGMALSRNIPAMERFSRMPAAEKNAFIEGCKGVNSKEEMQNYVDSLTIR